MHLCEGGLINTFSKKKKKKKRGGGGGQQSDLKS